MKFSNALKFSRGTLTFFRNLIQKSLKYRICQLQHAHKSLSVFTQNSHSIFTAPMRLLRCVIICCSAFLVCIHCSQSAHILAHLSTMCSIWAFVTVWQCVSASLRALTFTFKRLLLWNHSLDFDKNLQEWFLRVPLPKLFKPFQFIG